MSATFTDPGTLDTHTATIDWGDAAPRRPGRSAVGGRAHGYGDNGSSTSWSPSPTTTAIRQRHRHGSVGNVRPSSPSTRAAVSFPGGDYHVVEGGGSLAFDADGSDGRVPMT